MDPFTESELFDEDLPAASPLSIEESAEALRPSATSGSSALPSILARRLLACVAALLVAMLAAAMLSGAGSKHSPPSAPDIAHHDRHRQQSGINHHHPAGNLVGAPVAHPSPKASPESDIPPNPAAPRPTRVGPVGTERPTSPAHVGKMEQTQFGYLGR